MSEDKIEGGGNPARKAREERLAAALRANLRRRKAAGRMTPEPQPREPAESTPEGDEPPE